MKNVRHSLLALILFVCALISPTAATAGQIPIFGGTVKLSSDQVKDYVLSIQGNITSGGTLVWPAGVTGSWDITNSANAAIQIKYRDQGTPLIIAQGAEQLVYGNGQTLVAQSGSGGGAPSGAAGGDLGGTYPNPTVTSVAHVTTGVIPTSNGGTGLAQNTPTPLSPVASYYKYHAFGDSVTAGTNATTSAFDYVQLFAADLGATFTNYGYPGDQSCDQNNLAVFPNENPALSQNTIYSLMVGLNDSGQKGTGAYEPIYQTCHKAMLSWLAVPSQFKTFASTCTQTGTWTADSTYQTGIGLQSTTNGSTLTCSITTNGGPIYIWYRVIDGNTGTFTYQLDTSTAVPANAYTTPAIASARSTKAVAFARISNVAAGTHNVTFNVTSATGAGNIVAPFAIGTVPNTNEYTQPEVAALGVTTYLEGVPQASYVQYNSDAVADIALLRGDGLNIKFADTQSGPCPASVGCTGFLTPAGFVGDGVHPNNLGMSQLRDLLNYAVQPTPSGRGAFYPYYTGNGTFFPTYSWQSDPNTGFFLAGNGTIGIMAGAQNIGDFTTGGLRLFTTYTGGNGAANNPVYSFQSNGSTGMYYGGSSAVPLAFSSNNLQAATLDNNQHWRFGSVTAPTIASGACGTGTNGTIATGSTDHSGQIVIGASATSVCTVTFKGAWNTAASACIITPANAAAAAGVGAYVPSPTTTNFAIDGTTLANTSWNYWCE